jgi:hypothetical protein
VKRKPSGYGLAVAGLGLGLATLVIDQAGVELPTCLLIVLGAIAAVMIVGGLVIPHSSSGESASSQSNPCGDPKARRKLMAQGAEQLAHNLAEFEVWWPAVDDDKFDGRLVSKDGKAGHHITHERAMQTLLHKFAQFFSAQYTYQRQCLDHRPLKSVKKVYEAFTDAPGGPNDSDNALMSNQLHAVGKLSTSGWGTVDARPLELDEFQSALENDSQFAEAFQPLEEFLRKAAPGTESLIRLDAVAESVKRVEERLTKSALGRAFRAPSRLWARAAQSSNAAISSRDQM